MGHTIDTFTTMPPTSPVSLYLHLCTVNKCGKMRIGQLVMRSSQLRSISSNLPWSTELPSSLMIGGDPVRARIFLMHICEGDITEEMGCTDTAYKPSEQQGPAEGPHRRLLLQLLKNRLP